jgi:hypothetical protein
MSMTTHSDLAATPGSALLSGYLPQLRIVGALMAMLGILNRISRPLHSLGTVRATLRINRYSRMRQALTLGRNRMMSLSTIMSSMYTREQKTKMRRTYMTARLENEFYIRSYVVE